MVWGDADQDRHHWVHWEHPLCRAIFWGSLGASPLLWNILGSRYSPGRHIPKVREDIRTSTVVASPFGILYNLLLPSQAPRSSLWHPSLPRAKQIAHFLWF